MEEARRARSRSWTREEKAGGYSLPRVGNKVREAHPDGLPDQGWCVLAQTGGGSIIPGEFRTEPTDHFRQTVESLYFLWRTTGENWWREYAWRVIKSIEKHEDREWSRFRRDRGRWKSFQEKRDAEVRGLRLVE